MVLQENYTLHNGVKIPKLGLGTWFIENENAAQAVKDAVGLGYRHIDTAQAYGNESGVGEGIRNCGVARNELFVTTKLGAGIKSYDGALMSIDKSLAVMALDYIDMMIIHSPQPWDEFGQDNRYFDGNREAWRALEEAYTAGKIRAIGVSNFLPQDIDNILEVCAVKPMVNQILAHISNTPNQLINYCQENEVLVEAYSPIGHGELLKNKEIIAIAESYAVSVPQLCIRYALQMGMLPLPKTANPKHMQNNADLDFDISVADMDALKNFDKIKDYGEASVFPVYK
ncbi:aldo/keto reductase [Teredinibacter turnerae]|uniref:aldo/keto reductase n=1 Tax=Teredinibacter turnerae TaxID=2426 RepID=UPI0005F85AAB|nr:aldo/keto reductase [Teredinibacter turnerae]